MRCGHTITIGCRELNISTAIVLTEGAGREFRALAAPL